MPNRCQTILFSFTLLFVTAFLSLGLLPETAFAQNEKAQSANVAPFKSNSTISADGWVTTCAIEITADWQQKNKKDSFPFPQISSPNAEDSLAPQNTPLQILSARPFAPQNVNLYPEPYGLPYSPPSTAPPITVEQGEALLQQFAQTDPFVNAQQALAIYRDPAFRARISHPSLGVALAAVSFYPGGRAALDFYLNARVVSGLPKVDSIFFGQTPPDVGAMVQYNYETDQIRIIFNQTNISESPFLHMGTLLHEFVHQDAPNGRAEEIFGNAITALTRLILWQHHPQIFLQATGQTEFSRTIALAIYNSGQGGQLGILSSNNNSPIFPNSTVISARSFAEIYDYLPNFDTPGNELLHYYLNDFLRTIPRRRIICPIQSYNDSFISCFDRELAKSSRNNFSYFSPQNRLQLAQTMQLIVP